MNIRIGSIELTPEAFERLGRPITEKAARKAIAAMERELKEEKIDG